MADALIDPGELPYRRYGIPKLGFENYWYPIITTGELGASPSPSACWARTSCCSATARPSSPWMTAARTAG